MTVCMLSKFGDRFLSAGRVRPANQATTTILNWSGWCDHHTSASPAVIVWKVVGLHLFLNILPSNFMAGNRSESLVRSVHESSSEVTMTAYLTPSAWKRESAFFFFLKLGTILQTERKPYSHSCSSPQSTHDASYNILGLMQLPCWCCKLLCTYNITPEKPRMTTLVMKIKGDETAA